MKLRIITIVAITFLAATACFSPLGGGSDTGSVSVEIPSAAELRIGTSTLSASAEEDEDLFARVYLYKQGSRAGFGELPVSSDRPESLTIGGIAEGDDYRLVVTIGTKEGSYTFPEWFGTSGSEFRITGGGQTAVPVGMRESPFYYGLRNQAAKGVAIDEDGALITATSSTVYAFTPPDGTSRFVTPTASFSPDYTINSVDQGVDVGEEAPEPQDIAWISAQDRIAQPDFEGTDFISGTRNSNIIPPNALDGSRNILSSLGYFDSDSGKVVAMFQIDGGLGGGAIDDANAWGDTGEGLKDVVSGQPLYQLSIANLSGSEGGLFATQLGAFFAEQEVFENNDADALTEAFLTADNKSGLTFIDIVVSGESREISAMVARDSRIFIGTARGVFEVNDDDTVLQDGTVNVDAGEAEVVSGTQGLRITNLDLFVDGNDRILAALSDDRLVVVDLSRGSTAVIPTVAGVPGDPALGKSNSGVKAMSLLGYYSGESLENLFLSFAGDAGISVIDVSPTFFQSYGD